MTTNEMILKTIKTKTTKEAKYAPILADMGYKVIADNGWNGCNCYIVKNPDSGRSVCFSKGYDNKKHLYDCAIRIPTYYYDKVDYVHYLNTYREAQREEPSEYKTMRWKFERAKWDEEYHGDYIIRLRNQIEKLEKQIKTIYEDIEYHIDKRDEAVKNIDEVRTFILENMK